MNLESKNKVEKLVWIASTFEDVKFIKEFKNWYEGDIDVFHLNGLTFLTLVGKKNYLPKIIDNNKKRCFDEFEVNNSFNVLAKRMSISDAKKAYHSTKYFFMEYFKINQKAILVIPSGRHIHQIAAKKVANEYSIKTLFINYSNFPGYTFFDTDGTDSESSLYKFPNKLSSNMDGGEVNEIFKKFSDLKKSQLTIPQKKKGLTIGIIKKIAFYVENSAQKIFNYVGDR
jgi:hypothetical protein